VKGRLRREEAVVRELKAVDILLVEDNQDDVEITRRALRKGRVANDLHVVRDGQEALDFLLRQGDYGGDTPRPDLILLDLNLPNMSGLEVLEKTRADDGLSAIPVIVLTASEREEDVLRSYQLGSNTYITKPADFWSLVRAVGILGEYWTAIARLPPKEA
jgi:CheY-like chemotaxis protein